jgi:RNAse (barnase) inhibitor barstar
MILKIDAQEISDWDSFHDVFARVFEFPDYYGRNMDAWIDCMTDCIHYEKIGGNHSHLSEWTTIHLEHDKDFHNRCPEIFQALLDCVNFIKEHRHGLLALSFET